MSVTETRYKLLRCEFSPGETATDLLLYPLLDKWLRARGLAQVDSQQRSIDIYMSLYDQRFFANRMPVVAAIWKGYSENELKYMSAHNDMVNFWFVPTPNALPSLFYFLGLQGEKYTPRISTMYRDLFQFNAAFLNVNAAGKKSKKKRSESMEDLFKPSISLWYDYDGDPWHRQKIKLLLRLYGKLRQSFHEQGEQDKFVDLRFVLLTRDSLPFSSIDEDISEEHVDIEFCEDAAYFAASATNYMCFDYNATSYDTMAAAIGSECRIIAPPRMDLLGLEYVMLPPGLGNVLTAGLSPGSPGADGLLNMFLPVYTEMLNCLFYVNKKMKPE